MGDLLGIFISNGGVPKLPVETAQIEYNGVVGDRQEDTKHHGGLSKAVCVLENHVLLKLQADGHPIKRGSTGENLLISGYNLGIGSVFKIQSVELQVTSAAVPCKTIAESFLEGDFSNLSNKKYPGQTRWYCKVITPGKISVSY